MNRIKALFIADRIMTRIETDKAIHKDAIADEIQAAEVIDVISYDENKKCWVFRDGTPIEPEQVEPAEPPDGAVVDTPAGLRVRVSGAWVSLADAPIEPEAEQRQNLLASELFATGVQQRMSHDALMDLMLQGMSVQRIRIEDFKA